MAEDIVGYLAAKGLFLKRAAGNEVHLSCFFCQEPEGKRGRLYINTDPNADVPGLFMCQLCGTRGSLVTLKRHFGDITEREERQDDGFLRRAVLAAAAKYYHEALTDNLEAFRWLHNERGLSIDTIRAHQLGYADGGLYRHLRDLEFRVTDMLATGLITDDKATGRLVDFFNGHITIPYLVSGNVVMIRGRNLQGGERKYLTPTGQTTRLYNSDAVWTADEIVICEGEFDALIIEQMGLAVVAVPGANTWQDSWDNYFTDAHRVYVVFDTDDAGQKGATKVAGRLTPKARIVLMPAAEVGMPKNDPTELVVHQGMTAAAFTALLHEAIGGLLVTVEDAIREHTSLQGAKGIKFGIDALDQLTDPGLLPGQILVTLAKTNCLAGDTELSLNRAGKGFRITIKDLIDRLDGRRYVWDPSIPTFVQREADGVIRLARLKAAWCSGPKLTYTLRTAGGRSIRASAQHPFLTSMGWRRLDQLVVGDLLHVRGDQKGRGRTAIVRDRNRCGLRWHPYAKLRKDVPGGWKVQLHRLVYEAYYLNHLPMEEYLTRLRTGSVRGLTFLPSELVIHHLDGDHQNNEPTNLKVVTAEEHGRLHDSTANVQFKVALDAVVSIEVFGVEETYDIEVEDDPHNFVANGFICHNTGKTLFLLNLFQRICMVNPDAKVLFISLEQTRGDWWERARRIYRFLHPGSTDLDAMRFWRDRILLVDANRVTEDQCYEVLDDYHYEMGQNPDVVGIDYLGYFARSFKGESYERTGQAIMAMKAVAKDRRVPIIAPHQVSRGILHGTAPSLDTARDSGVVEETADHVFLLWSEDTLAERDYADRKGELKVKVGKSRHGGVGYVQSMFFAPLTLAIVPDGDGDRTKWARNELAYKSMKETWEQALIRHQVGRPVTAEWKLVAAEYEDRQKKLVSGNVVPIR